MKRAFLLCLVAIAPAAIWAYSFVADDIYYNIIDGGVEVTWGGSSYSSGTSSYTGAITIPETVMYDGADYGVIAIGEYAFYYCKLTAITLPESILTIGQYAFSHSEITDITIPNSVTYMDHDVFYSCKALETAVVGEGIEELHNYAFQSCEKLSSIDLGKVKLIDSSVFSGCTSLAEIVLPVTLTKIGSSAFGSCTKLLSITSLNPEPPSCEYSSFFESLYSSATVYVPAGKKEVYAQAWYNFKNFVELPGSFAITAAGYATYYTDNAYIMPEGVIGTTVTGVGSASSDGGYYLTMPWEYAAGTTVPAGTALVLQGEEGTYEYSTTESADAAPTDNILIGTTVEEETYGPAEDVSYVFYELTNGDSGIGFYYGAEGGAPFLSAANKAWLALTADQAHGAKFLGFGEGDTMGIAAGKATTAKTVGGIYTLQGLRVSDMHQKGIYIVDGKKVIVK